MFLSIKTGSSTLMVGWRSCWEREEMDYLDRNALFKLKMIQRLRARGLMQRLWRRRTIEKIWSQRVADFICYFLVLRMFIVFALILSSKVNLTANSYSREKRRLKIVRLALRGLALNEISHLANTGRQNQKKAKTCVLTIWNDLITWIDLNSIN